MSASFELAAVLVDELVRGGVREAVLSPGSRNAPLAYALNIAEAAGRLRLHVRLDERSAGFLALGLAKVSGRPVPVACTSGTATANLHPAVLEAGESGVPLVVLTADRPPELRGVGANQTVDQTRLYGGAVRDYAELGELAVAGGARAAYWRSVTSRMLVAASGALTGDAGPVHLNVPLREPLVPGRAGQDAAAATGGRPDGRAWTAAAAGEPVAAPLDGEPERTLVVVGDCPPDLGARARAWAEAAGWPLLAEPSSGARGGGCAVPGYAHLLTAGLPPALRPDRVLVVGRPTLSRGVSALLADPRVDVEVRTASPRWPDAGRRASRVALGLPPAPDDGGRCAEGPVSDWARCWRAAAGRAEAALADVLDGPGRLTGLRLARRLPDVLPDGGLVVVGSSLPVRDVDVAGGGLEGLRVVANRGVAGIDGTVSTAVGAALAWDGPAYAVLGDLTFLHDANGLLAGPGEAAADLCLVVVDNDGGRIFGGLEQATDGPAGALDRLFVTPQRVDLSALCAATGTPYTCVDDADGLAAALAPRPGLRMVHVPVDPAAAAAESVRLSAALAATLAGAG